jgi:hypothetical protein
MKQMNKNSTQKHVRLKMKTQIKWLVGAGCPAGSYCPGTGAVNAQRLLAA